MEFSFLWIAIKSSILKALEHRQDPFYVFQFGFVMHKDVIMVNFNSLVQEWCEHFIHALLETQRSICKSESHNLHSKWSERCHKCSFPFIAGPDPDLIIPRLQIELGECDDIAFFLYFYSYYSYSILLHSALLHSQHLIPLFPQLLSHIVLFSSAVLR